MRGIIKWLQSDIRRTLLAFWRTKITLAFNKTPVAEVYLSLSDPFSFILVQVLPQLEQRFNIKFKLFLIYSNLSHTASDVDLWRLWAFKDAIGLADRYNLLAPERKPSQQMLLTAQQTWQMKDKTLKNALDIFHATWVGEFGENFGPSTPVITHQVKNHHRQKSKGHYSAATILFCGEWYLGIDRLNHLETRLIALGLAKQKNAEQYFSHNKESINADENTPISKEVVRDLPLIEGRDLLEVFISLRSPYSYLGFIKAQRLSQRNNLPLQIKPVLPMLMRGLSVGKNKQAYIFKDALREAKVNQIPFESFCDPLGQGIIKSYQLFSYAEKQNLAQAYIKALFDAIYVKGIDLAQDKNIKSICQQLGLDYQKALDHNIEHDWQLWVDINQQSLSAMNLWGVPCFRFQKLHCWGQDRLWQVEDEILKEKNK